MLDSRRYVQHAATMILYLVGRILQLLKRSIHEFPQLFEPFRYDPQDAGSLHEEHSVLDLFICVSRRILRDFTADEIRRVRFYLFPIL